MGFARHMICLALALTTGLCARSETVKGVVGDIDAAFTAVSVDPGASVRLPVDLRGAGVASIVEIYPETPDQPTYRYDVLVGGRLLGRRDHTGTGFGPVRFFVRVPAWARKAGGLRLVNRGGRMLVSGAEAVTDSALSSIERKDEFGLFGLAPYGQGAERAGQWVDELGAKLPSAPGVYRGLAVEIPYARWPREALERQMSENLEWCGKHKLALMPLFVSWWSGTPVGIPDGLGGTFTDVGYQQVCWSPDSTPPDDPRLRALLGDRWDPHYCLSVPNEWADTPWLTMNSPRLNDYRNGKLDEALRLFAERWSGSTVRVAGVCLENEPRYWDTACEAGNPKRDIGALWADFNPLVIADAARDGVNLDPKDGLDRRERLWLHRNVSRYAQGVVDTALRALTASAPGLSDRVYTHSLQLLGFPGDQIGHPMSEWAYARGARVGLEGMWMKLSDLDRVVEWGPWANINREETDGQEIGTHLWDLRVTYARGGSLYNTYNWQAVGPDRVFGYMKAFLDGLPSPEIAALRPVVKAQSIELATSLDLRAANRVNVQVDLPSPVSGDLVAEAKDGAGRTIGLSVATGPFASGTREVDFVFAQAFESSPSDRVLLTITGSGRPIAVFGARAFLDLRRERTLSLWTIAHGRARPARR